MYRFIVLIALCAASLYGVPLSVKVIAPDGGEKFFTGDTVTVRWKFAGDGAKGYHNVVFRLSLDAGLNYDTPLFSKGFIYEGDSGAVQWVVPAGLSSKEALLKVYEYQNTSLFDESDDFFTLVGTPNPGKLPDEKVVDLPLVQGWKEMSGGRAGMVAYADMNSIWVIDLLSGARKKVANVSWASSVKISPNGKRICIQNNSSLIVVNADGSNSKSIWNGSLRGDLIAAGWDGNSAVVYSVCLKIARTTIGTDNSAIETSYIYTTPPQVACYSSVEKSGDYLCFLDMEANLYTGGYHRPCIYNIKTKTLKELVARDEDGCNLRLRPDSSGVSMYNFWNHDDPARIVDKNGAIIDKIPPVNNSGIGGLRWSNDPRYMIHNGANGNEGRAWIRDLNTKKYVLVGNGVVWPDLWVGSGNVSNVEVVSSSTNSKQPFTCLRAGDHLYHIRSSLPKNFTARIISAQGKTLKTLNSNGSYLQVDISNLPAGLHFLKITSGPFYTGYQLMVVAKRGN